MVCTFFGHADAPDTLKENIRSTLIDLIENKNVNIFYVGNNGNFDSMVINQLEQLSSLYDFKYYVILAYLPKQNNQFNNTIFPEGIENQPPKFAISFRNKWMIEKSDYVVTYVKRSFGGAYKFKNISIRKEKKVIEIF